MKRKLSLAALPIVLLLAGNTGPGSSPYIAYEELYYDLYGNHTGHYVIYCNGHEAFVGTIDVNSYFYEYDCS